MIQAAVANKRNAEGNPRVKTGPATMTAADRWKLPP